MTETKHIPKEVTQYQHTGLFRICETNPAYDVLPGGKPGPGWIFVSNELEIEAATERQKECEKRNPKLTYTIVPVFKEHNN